MNVYSILSDALLDYECGNISDRAAARRFQTYGWELALPISLNGVVQAVDDVGTVHNFETAAAAYSAVTLSDLSWDRI